MVAAENFWGNLATQLGGNHVSVSSVISDPNADPHEYASSTETARKFATADLVILNGAGYDQWGNKLLDANASEGRVVLNIADFLGRKNGVNPHFWYNPEDVFKVIDEITANYQTIDPVDGVYFQEQHKIVENALIPYKQRLALIKSEFAGTPIASTEEIVSGLASYTGLDLISPQEFMQAVSEGNDPSAASVAIFEHQVASDQLKLLVYNEQTANALTTALKNLAIGRNIPIVAITETVQPPTANFQDWMDNQLNDLILSLNQTVNK